MKAKAKRNCTVMKTDSLGSIFFHKINIKKAEEFDLPVFKEQKFRFRNVVKVLGEKMVAFKLGGKLLVTYSSDFDYFEEKIEQPLDNTKKICRRCRVEKDKDKFAKNSYYKDGHDITCKSCRNKPAIKKFSF